MLVVPHLAVNIFRVALFFKVSFCIQFIEHTGACHSIWCSLPQWELSIKLPFIGCSISKIITKQ